MVLGLCFVTTDGGLLKSQSDNHLLAMAESRRQGIPIDANSWQELLDAAHAVGLDPLALPEPSA